MATADLLIYGLLLIPFVGVLIAGYGRMKVGPFFGIIVALGAGSLFLSYLLFDLATALFQLGALALGAAIFLLALGLLGDRFSYRSPMLLLASVALFPLGLLLSTGYLAPLIVHGSLLVANIGFALLLGYLRRNTLRTRKGQDKPKDRYLLTLPAVVSTVVVGLMVLNSFSQGTLL